MDFPGVGKVGLGSFNSFYNNYISKEFDNEYFRILTYRDMARNTEIADVIEDATNESTQEDHEGKTLKLIIKDPNLSNNENIVNNLEKEFNHLFYEVIDFKEILWDMIRTYYIDGRTFYERVIDTRNSKKGIINIKKLPSETMEYFYNPITGEIEVYFQYLTKERKNRPKNLDEAKRRNDIIVFNKEQIGMVNYGIYGSTRNEIFGYLEKSIIPYNQLKLLETSVIIYRLIRAPERLVFRIDTGNMPRDKALKYVEKIKKKLTRKQTYDPTSGNLSNDPEIFSMLENYYLPQSADGRGSQIESVGGNAAGFTELDDVYYFQRKLYKSLKYPMSRVESSQAGQTGDIMFGGNSTGEISRDEIKWSNFLERQQVKFCEEFISRDEIKWSNFLERQQVKFCEEFTDMFLLHLEFKGLVKQYGLDKKKIATTLTPPSNYKEQMEQNFLETRFNNYQSLADREEFSKYHLMKTYLKWSDEEIQANVKGRKRDKEYGFASDEDSMGGFSDRRLKYNINYL
jgi:hypothetical protein